MWSLNFVVTKYALRHGFSPLVWSLLRMALATVAFSAFTFGFERDVRMPRRGVLVLLGAGAVVLLANQLTFIYAIDLTTASTVALLFGTMPIYAGLLERRAHGARHWAAAVLSFGGVALVALGAHGGVGGHLGGILLALAAPGTWVVYSILGGPWVRRSSPGRVNALGTIGCTLPFLVVGAPQLGRQHWAAIPPSAWLLLFVSALPSYALTNLLWFRVVELAGTARAALYVNLQPFLGTVFAVLLLSESLGWLQVVGGAVIAAGIVLSRWRKPLDLGSEP